MYDLEVSVQGHRLVLPFPGHMMTSDNIQVDRIHFTFDNNWTGYTCTALFWGYDTDTPYSVQLTNGYAVIPAEVLADKGKIYFGVFGIKGNSRITSNTVSYTIMNGAWSDDIANTGTVTPTLVEQLLSAAETAMSDARIIQESAMNQLADKSIESYSLSWTSGGYIDNTNGSIVAYSSWKYTDFVEIGSNTTISVTSTAPDNKDYNAFYDEHEVFLDKFTAEGVINVPDGAKYFRLSCRNSETVTVSYDLYTFKYLDYSNILFSSNLETVNTASSQGYASRLLYTYNGTISLGDIYTVQAKIIKNNPDTSPFAIYLYNGSTLVRTIYSNIVNIIQSDISGGVNKIEFYLYPARGSGLIFGDATFENITITKGRPTGVTLSDDLRDAVVNTMNFSYSLPDYYFANNYLQNKARAINEYGKEASDVFIFITDVHWSSNRQLSLPLINYINCNCHIPRLFSGGDTGDGYNEEFCDGLRRVFPHKIYHVIGNHEWFADGTASNLYYLMDSYNNDQIGNPDRHYYYVDNVQQRIRYIILNAFHAGDEFDYDASELDWFVNEALNMPQDWDVIVFTHFMGMSSKDEQTSVITFIGQGSEYATAIDTFNSNTDRNGKVLAVFQGHNHADAIYHTVGGTPIITTTCDKCGAYGNTEPYIRQYRRVGTITEQAFDVVAVKRVISGNVRNITITCVRVGAPAMDNIDVPYTEGDFDFTSTLETRQVTRSFPYQTGGD